MSWSIICEARKGRGAGIETLALVDRRITKKTWWTSDDAEVVLQYRKKSAADYACSRLLHNGAEVVPSDHAIEIIKAQENALLEMNML